MPSRLAAHFRSLNSFLLRHQDLWRPRPFTHRHLPWEHQHPELGHWLRRRSLADAETAHHQPALLREAPAPFPALAAEALALSQVETLFCAPPQDHAEPVAVPGRKWQQIQAFCDHLQFDQAPQHWLDWCAGKGHLGHHLASNGTALTCLERDEALVSAGQLLARRSLPMARHLHQDVMAEDAARHLGPSITPVALHACGDLHVRLLQLAVRQGCRQLAIAPCCYNRIADDSYQPLSTAGHTSTLRLSRDELGLPLSETVTAGARVRRQRDLSMARRLSFDLLQRQLRNIDEYLNTPSLPAGWLNKSCADYCRELAALKNLPDPGEQDWPALEAAGWQRLAEVRNLELVRGLFRRPLELWLVLDRALFLEEQGFQVRLGHFCPSELTPRNLLLIAER
ncbi:methyltransferase [Serpens gallinarum]|uniref:Methyltransferase n=1 Tax=Serpens gallinarum TaxID=2763075 RepID=A0ABR8TJ32_9PSED|nr:methyltransferase [Serpens gallinarum]MBD7975782.1 methyltransferase [Serpens gallinarum]